MFVPHLAVLAGWGETGISMGLLFERRRTDIVVAPGSHTAKAAAVATTRTKARRTGSVRTVQAAHGWKKSQHITIPDELMNPAVKPNP
jgi:hypothetical protein